MLHLNYEGRLDDVQCGRLDMSDGEESGVGVDGAALNCPVGAYGYGRGRKDIEMQHCCRSRLQHPNKSVVRKRTTMTIGTDAPHVELMHVAPLAARWLATMATQTL